MGDHYRVYELSFLRSLAEDVAELQDSVERLQVVADEEKEELERIREQQEKHRSRYRSTRSR
jgi:reverse gyrase